MKIKKIKIFVSLLLVIGLMSGCGSGVTTKKNDDLNKRVFEDSLGRKVTLDKDLNQIAPSGTMAQLVLAGFAPEKLAVIARKPSDKVLSKIKNFPVDKPEVGQFYGKKPNFNKEEVIKAHPQVIVDIGEKKKNIEEDLQTMQDNTGIPVVFIELTPKRVSDAYKKLGDLLGMKEKAEKIANFFDKNNKIIEDGLKKVSEDKRKTFIQIGGKDGLQIDPKGSSHTEAAEFAGGKNLAHDKGDNKDKKSKTEGINIEEVINWKPSVIIVKSEDAKQAIEKDASWKPVLANNPEILVVPSDPYSYVDAPPSVNKMLGVYWLAQKFYPDVFTYDFDQIKKQFDSLIFGIN